MRSARITVTFEEPTTGLIAPKITSDLAVSLTRAEGTTITWTQTGETDSFYILIGTMTKLITPIINGSEYSITLEPTDLKTSGQTRNINIIAGLDGAEAKSARVTVTFID